MKRLLRAVLFPAALLAAGCGAAPGAEEAASDQPAASVAKSVHAPRRSPVPPPRGVAPTPSPARARLADAGPVCDDPRLVGLEIAPVVSGVDGCGIDEPVRLVRIAGVSLSRSVRLNCAAARTVADWMEKSAKPAATTDVQSALVSVRPVAAYACRTRNSRRGARISEHARGNALDIAAFTFADGTTATVLNGFEASGPHGRFLRKVWKEACDVFGTVLGPRSDRHHRDHFHVDIARHRNGAYCR